jgi:hypothetical protein
MTEGNGQTLPELTTEAERQRAQFERESRMGIFEPNSVRLSEFLADSLVRTRGQVRENTLAE